MKGQRVKGRFIKDYRVEGQRVEGQRAGFRYSTDHKINYRINNLSNKFFLGQQATPPSPPLCAPPGPPPCARWTRRGAGWCVPPGPTRSRCSAAAPGWWRSAPRCSPPPRAAASASSCRAPDSRRGDAAARPPCPAADRRTRVTSKRPFYYCDGNDIFRKIFAGTRAHALSNNAECVTSLPPT